MYHDLEQFLKDNDCKPVDLELDFDERITDYLKILLILYADDTVIFSDSEFNLQKALDNLEKYCKIWKLSINCSKTKVLIFCMKKSKKEYPFILNGKILEHVTFFKYLGITFNYNGRFNVGVRELKVQGRRAMFSLVQKCRMLQLPISVQLELFNSLVQPILTYSCEVWGYSNVDIIESLQLEFLKYIMNMKKSTPSCLVYGESGQFPLYIHVYCRMVIFWHKLIMNNENKMSKLILKTLYECHKFNIYKSEWLEEIEQILDTCGLSYIWENPINVTTSWLKNKIVLILKDMFIQTWTQQCSDVNKSCNYNLYKTSFGFESYLDNLPSCYRIPLTKLRTSNHKLPIEKGRYINLPREERTCNLCNLSNIGDEYHFLLECPVLSDLRSKFIPKYYSKYPNFYKYSELLSLKNHNKILKLSKFVKAGLSLFK